MGGRAPRAADAGPARGQPAAPIDVDLRGAAWLLLRADDAGDDREDDYADWADARLECRR
ncbi:MAG: NPCBM/NEW2 domain-containing protein [Sandaracinaceae bacterium]|nr:NPCBM/NEW2 domain-containing protein [Sandaracinaceae bacterium]